MNIESDRSRRRALLALLGSGIGLSGVLRLAVAQSRTQGLQRVQGEVLVNGAPAAVGALVRPGDTVSTGKGALAVFTVGQDAFLMRDNSRAELAGKETFVNLLRLATGKLLGVFASGGDRRIVTTTATVGIRGTGGYFEAEPARTYFCLCYGTADIATAGGEARDSYSARHHDSPRYIYGDGRKNAIVPASVSNHTDAELIMLEALVGRTPPQSVMDGPAMDNPYRY